MDFAQIHFEGYNSCGSSDKADFQEGVKNLTEQCQPDGKSYFHQSWHDLLFVQKTKSNIVWIRGNLL